MKRKNNNEQINNTDYYRLPCGRYLEDFIWINDLSFAEGSALKYLWRAGKKDGESVKKDLEKCHHYCKFIAQRVGIIEAIEFDIVSKMCEEAKKWNGRFQCE